jgi:hypothetical protein
MKRCHWEAECALPGQIHGGRAMTAFVCLRYSGSGGKERQRSYSGEGKLSNSSRTLAAILAEVAHGRHSEGAPELLPRKYPNGTKYFRFERSRTPQRRDERF